MHIGGCTSLKGNLIHIHWLLLTIFTPKLFTIFFFIYIYNLLDIYVHRYLGELKSFVRNKARPEGSIAESFLADECMTFCSRYLQGFSTKHNQPSRNDDNPEDSESSLFLQQSMLFPQVGKPLGRPMVYTLTDKEATQAHRYVLFNCDAVKPYLE